MSDEEAPELGKDQQNEEVGLASNTSNDPVDGANEEKAAPSISSGTRNEFTRMHDGLDALQVSNRDIKQEIQALGVTLTAGFLRMQNCFEQLAAGMDAMTRASQQMSSSFEALAKDLKDYVEASKASAAEKKQGEAAL